MNNLLIKTLITLNLLRAYFYTESKNHELCYVMDPSMNGWILKHTCENLKIQLTEMNSFFSYRIKNLPRVKYYFFPHYYFFKKALAFNPHLFKQKCIVYFTHPREDLGISNNELIQLLKIAHGVVVLNVNFKNYLIELGIPEEKIQVIYFGYDPLQFISGPRKLRNIGFSSAYYERKNPKLMIEIISRLPEFQFHLFGKGWQNSPYWEQLSNFKNLKYSEPTMLELPNAYHQLSILISPSLLEGGPTPILEAIASNVIVIASNTGFAPDVIQNGKNGFVFDLNDNIDNIIDIIRNAEESIDENDISKSVTVGTWQECTNRFRKFLS